MQLRAFISGEQELIGSYEQDRILKGEPENYDKPSVSELTQNWTKYNAYAKGKYKLCQCTADDLLSDTLTNLAQEIITDELVLSGLKSLESHIKSRIDYTYSSGMNNAKTSFRPINNETPLEVNYEGADRDSTYNLSDRLQISKGDGLSKYIIDITSEIEEAKPYRFLSNGVDMFKVIYIMLCGNESDEMDLSEIIPILQNVLGYDTESVDIIKKHLYKDSKIYELWRALNAVEDSIIELEKYIGCTNTFKSVFLKKQ